MAVTDKCSFYFHRIDAELPNKDLGGEMCLAHFSGLEIVVKKNNNNNSNNDCVVLGNKIINCCTR